MATFFKDKLPLKIQINPCTLYIYIYIIVTIWEENLNFGCHWTHPKMPMS